MTVKTDEKDKNMCKRKYESILQQENKVTKEPSPKLKRKKVKQFYLIGRQLKFSLQSYMYINMYIFQNCIEYFKEYITIDKLYFQMSTIGIETEPVSTCPPSSLCQPGAALSVPATVCYEGEGNKCF